MDITQGFQDFWQQYPRKIGRLVAQKAYAAVRQRGVSHEALIAGIENYVAHKPAYADWCHPSTWLRAGRWLDEYDDPAPVVPVYWWDECQQVHGGTCTKRWDHDLKMRERRAEATGPASPPVPYGQSRRKGL